MKIDYSENEDTYEKEMARMNRMPKTLYQYVALTDDESENEKRFRTLQTNSIWFSRVSSFNDPYEHKGMYFMKETTGDIDTCERSFEDIGVACFTENDFTYLPMWAYYANNSKGYCVEYSVCKPNNIHKVLYEKERMNCGKLLTKICECYDNIEKAENWGNKLIAIYKRNLLEYGLMQNAYIKDVSWEHEKEYRISLGLNNEGGMDIKANRVGLQLNRIVAGINCSDENKRRLWEISNSLECNDLLCAKSCDTTFGIDLIVYKP